MASESKTKGQIGLGSTSYLDDFFLKPEPDIEYLRNILINPKSACYGIVQQSILKYFTKEMLDFVTEMIMATCTVIPEPLAQMRVIFCVYIVRVEGVRIIIQRQLQRNKDLKGLEFFERYFVKFATIIIQAFLNHPFYPEDINFVFGMTAAKLQTFWATKCTALLTIEMDYEQKLIAEHHRRIQEKKESKKKPTKKSHVY